VLYGNLSCRPQELLALYDVSFDCLLGRFGDIFCNWRCHIIYHANYTDNRNDIENDYLYNYAQYQVIFTIKQQKSYKVQILAINNLIVVK